ncbi:hypothetical protein OKW33_006533 [Paraburkholderia atlantica]|nr:hypothetical protein [Paraburkholderia atlantica]
MPVNSRHAAGQNSIGVDSCQSGAWNPEPEQQKSGPEERQRRPARGERQNFSHAKRTGLVMTNSVGMVSVGSASWTDPTLIASKRFYPLGCTNAEARLRFYATQFPLVEDRRSPRKDPAEQSLVETSAYHVVPDGESYRVPRPMPESHKSGLAKGGKNKDS